MSSERPLVSIIIDNYNYARFVGAAIESALAQSYERCEVIVVDDGSTDDSAEVIGRYGTVQSIFKANGGQASAFNSGFEVCKGDIVVFLDADDLLHPEAARWAVDAFLTGPDVVKVQFRMQVVDGDGRPTGAVVPPPHVRMPTGDVRGHLAKGNFTWWTPNSGQLWRTTALRRLFPLPEPDLRMGVDHFLQPTVAMLGHVVSLEQPGALYRLHGANDTLRTDLDLPHLRQLLERSHAIHGHVLPFARANGMPSYPADFADTEDIILLAVRMTSLRLDRAAHPVPDKGLLGVTRLGVAASFTRPDVTLIPRIANALWFVAMLVVPRRVAAHLARTLFYPASRGRWEAVVRVMTASRLRLGARRRRSDPEHVGVL